VDSSSTVFFSFIAQQIPREPKHVSGRILVISICFTGAVLFWSYSAGLVSFLTFEKYEYPIKTLAVSCFEAIYYMPTYLMLYSSIFVFFRATNSYYNMSVCGCKVFSLAQTHKMK
jgi:hypothetical protein